jgi:hypothetical protein
MKDDGNGIILGPIPTVGDRLCGLVVRVAGY